MIIEVVFNVLIWQGLLEMADLAAYAPIWEIRSYGGHTGNEMVIRNRDATAILVPNSSRL